jgi:hypothetical protein
MTSDQDLLIAILTAEHEATDDGYLTMQDLQELSGKRPRVLYDLMHELDRAGRLECQMVRRRNIAGAMQARPAYRLRKDVVKSDSED